MLLIHGLQDFVPKSILNSRRCDLEDMMSYYITFFVVYVISRILESC